MNLPMILQLMLQVWITAAVADEHSAEQYADCLLWPDNSPVREVIFCPMYASEFPDLSRSTSSSIHSIYLMSTLIECVTFEPDDYPSLTLFYEENNAVLDCHCLHSLRRQLEYRVHFNTSSCNLSSSTSPPTVPNISISPSQTSAWQESTYEDLETTSSYAIESTGLANLTEAAGSREKVGTPLAVYLTAGLTVSLLLLGAGLFSFLRAGRRGHGRATPPPRAHAREGGVFLRAARRLARPGRRDHSNRHITFPQAFELEDMGGDEFEV